ncbi:SOUL family heme-binding protein [Rhodococcoides corynebacterioides]|uniref:SOUL family heme-binding protein n=1 Tax=Rhodococcoides corynebacterioides TaxID=53972 RepID=UPI0008316DEE|nr:heme-binding protein [Rhodococcus corynebacterioides]
MLQRVTTVATQVAESVLGIVGVRVGTEEPPHTSEALTDAVEIRRYEARIAAETTVEGDEEQARNEGFRRLAGYIFGRNRASESIAMTAPVAQSSSRSQTIAMTAPVSRAATDAGWVIRFFMPSRWTMATLPVPEDDRVRLVEVPPETVAVVRFSGDRGADAVATRTDELLSTLRERGIETTGEPMSWFYDPPWTVPFRRRNEVAVPIAR